MLQLFCRKGLGLQALTLKVVPRIMINKSVSLRCGDWEADPLPAKMVNDYII